jgi:alkylhydroperoxidase family enzyme
VTVAPWTLRRGSGVTDDELLHVVALSSYFGHLNRIADAVAVPLDYAVQLMPAPADPSVPALSPAPAPITQAPVLQLAARPATHAAIEAWRAYVLERDDKPPMLTLADRALIAAWVAEWLGDGVTPAPDAASTATYRSLGDIELLRRLAETVTLAPWQLTDASYAGLRARGFNDAALFDVCVVASTAGVVSRIAVALGALR